MKASGFIRTKLENEALELAWLRWQDFESFNSNVCRAFEDADRSLFTQLGKAVRMLQNALEPFVSSPTNPEIARLSFRLQEAENFSHQQHHYQAMLDDLCEPLELLNQAAKTEAGGAGRTSDPYERRWILIAADSWLEICRKVPHASGRFFAALSDFQNSHAVPIVTERNLRTVLTERKTSELGDQPTTSFNSVPVTEDVVNYAIGCVLAISSTEIEEEIRQRITQSASQQTRLVYGGERMYIPLKKGGSDEIRNAKIRNEHQAGESAAKLQKRYGLSKSRIWQIIKE
jgi:hypothetical protein